MRAIVCDAPGQVSLKDIPVPAAGPGEVVVRVRAALTCGTDLKLMRRGHPKIPFPVTLGHEFAGEVHASGEGAPFLAGEHVASAVSGPCGDCPDCAAGRMNLCQKAFDDPVWGAFAEFVRVPAPVVRRGLKGVRERVPFEAAALLDPLASVVHGFSRVSVRPDLTVLLYGSGPIAMLFAILARQKGAGVIVAGRRPGRLALFAEQAVRTIDLNAGAPEDAVREVTGGRGADVVVDTTADPALAPKLVSLAGRGGTVLFFAGMPAGSKIEVDAGRLHYDEVSVVGSFHYTPADVEAALELVSGGWIPLHALVTARARLQDFREVFASLEQGQGMKTAFIP